MSVLEVTLAVAVAVLFVTLVLVIALMRTQREDALFEHDIDVEKMIELRSAHNDLSRRYLELRKHSAAELTLARRQQVFIELLEGQRDELLAQQQLRKF